MPSSRRSSRRPYGEGHRPLDPDRLRGIPRTERDPAGREFVVRQVGASDAEYRCPGCEQILTGVAHVVAWPSDHLFGDGAGLAERRHWHTACWQARRGGRR